MGAHMRPCLQPAAGPIERGFYTPVGVRENDDMR
jgi:hypothetical protein